MESFTESTVDPTNFVVENVANDNACFYRSLANSLNHNSESTDLLDLINKVSYGKFKSIENVYRNTEWGFAGEQQDILARKLQELSHSWVKDNGDEYIDEYGMDLNMLIEMTHEIDIGEYLDRYKYFAGDMVIDKYDTGETKSGEPIYDEQEIGGM